MKLSKITFLIAGLFALSFFMITDAYASDRHLNPNDYTQFGNVEQNPDGSISFNLILNNDQGCNDVWEWFRIEAILANGNRETILEGDNDHLAGFDAFKVDDPDDDIDIYFRTNYLFTVDEVFNQDGGDLKVRLTWRNPPLLLHRNSLVLKGHWRACDNDWEGYWTGDEWMRTVYQVYTEFTPQSGTKLGIAQYWAPRVYHDTRDDTVCVGINTPFGCLGSKYQFYKEQDMLAKVDFDGDWDARNNWENNSQGNNGAPLAPRAYAYTSFVETDTHYFLGYHYFHPTDDAQIPQDRHENDLEDVYICVLKGIGFGTFEAMLTQSHGDFNKYKKQDLHFTQGHPHIFITSNGVGLGNIGNVLGLEDHGHSIYKYTRNSLGDFSGDDGIIYNVGEVSEIPANSRQYNDGSADQYTYALVDINELWNRRFDISQHPFHAYHAFGGEGSNGKDTGAYIGWTDAELYDPANKFLEYYGDLGINWSKNYIHNPYNQGPTGADATPALRGMLPAGWQSTNIGNPHVTGKIYYTHTTFTIDGAGGDISGTSDQFNYVYTFLSGDGELVARVYDMQDNVHNQSKAGVMIRETTQANSKFAMMLVHSTNKPSFLKRVNTGDEVTHVNYQGLKGPLWVKIVRSGNTFTAYYSTDGEYWGIQGTQTIQMNQDVLIGLAVSAYQPDWLCSTVVDNVQLQGNTSSKTTSLVIAKKEHLAEQLRIYPNPLKKNTAFYVNFGETDLSEKVSVSIYTSSGAVVYQKNKVKRKVLKLNKKLATGIYMVCIRTDASLVTKKLVVE